MIEAAEVCRVLGRYAKQYQAGAFAVPLVGDVIKAQQRGDVHEWADEEGVATLAVSTRATRNRRKDFTGAEYVLAPGARVITHIAHLRGPVPDLSEFDYVYAYREDRLLSDGLAAQGRAVRAVRISAASEIVGCWARPGEGRRYPPHDAASLTEVVHPIGDGLRDAVTAEVESLDGWHDDYPFYNRDGSWSALSLRGYKPDDPTWGIKPPEMSKRWWSEHPEAAALSRCDWTVLADKLPAVMSLIGTVEWWRRFERIRLLKLSGRGGEGGTLLRHTDITDRTAGTRDGQICRFHIPIVSHPSVRTVVWDADGRALSANLAPWRLYYLDQRKPHMVTNPSSVERVHLVVDVLADEHVRRRIAESVPA